MLQKENLTAAEFKWQSLPSFAFFIFCYGGDVRSRISAAAVRLLTAQKISKVGRLLER